MGMVTHYLLYKRQGYVGSCKAVCGLIARCFTRNLQLTDKEEFGKDPSEPFEFAVFSLTAKTAGAYILARSVNL